MLNSSLLRGMLFQPLSCNNSISIAAFYTLDVPDFKAPNDSLSYYAEELKRKKGDQAVLA